MEVIYRRRLKGIDRDQGLDSYKYPFKFFLILYSSVYINSRCLLDELFPLEKSCFHFSSRKLLSQGFFIKHAGFFSEKG